jgi:hypothetical protein
MGLCTRRTPFSRKHADAEKITNATSARQKCKPSANLYSERPKTQKAMQIIVFSWLPAEIRG